MEINLKNKKLTSVIWWILLLGLLVKLMLYLISNQQYFTRIFNFDYYSDLYSKSQYVIGAASKGGIGDDGLYAFAGYYYLFQKGDVSAVNFEHPPLGKYLIGVSIMLFHNENIINIIYFAVLLWVTYIIGKIILKNSLLSLIAVGILSADPLFLDNLKRSLLDLPFTLFFTLAVYFFLLALGKQKYLYLSMLFWGITFSTRFFPALVIIYGYLLLIILLHQRKNLQAFFLSSLLIPVVYLIAHTSYFFYHPSFIEFLRHKKWMLAWFSGSVRIVGNIWRNIFTGYYLDTTYKLVQNEHWFVSVPAIVVPAVLPLKKYFDKKNLDLLLLYGLSILYFIYMTFLTDGSEKFMMPIYPLLCILAINNIALLYSIIGTWKKAISVHSKGN